MKTDKNPLAELRDSGDAENFACLVVQIFLTYLGTKNFSKLAMVDKTLVLELYDKLYKYFLKEEERADKRAEKRSKQEKVA